MGLLIFFVYLIVCILSAPSVCNPASIKALSPFCSGALRQSEPAYQNPVVLAWLSRYVCLYTSPTKSEFWPHAKIWYLNMYIVERKDPGYLACIF